MVAELFSTALSPGLAEFFPELYAIATRSDPRAWISLWCKGRRVATDERLVDLVIDDDANHITASADAQWSGSLRLPWNSCEIGIADRPGGEPVYRLPLNVPAAAAIADYDVVSAEVFVGFRG